MLAGKLDDDQTRAEFIQVLIWMYKRKPLELINPLEVIVDLAKAKKCLKLVSFTIENVNATFIVDFKVVGKKVRGATPIHLAAFFGLKKTIEKMLKRNPSLINKTNKEGLSSNTSIHTAAIYGHLKIVTYLADFTDNPNSKGNNGNTPIHFAAFTDHLGIVKFLAGFTETPNAANNQEKTPIYHAKRNNHLEVVKFLKSVFPSTIFLNPIP